MMQLAHQKVAQPKLKSAMEHWPSRTDARQSAEKPLHEAAANHAGVGLDLNMTIMKASALELLN